VIFSHVAEIPCIKSEVHLHAWKQKWCRVARDCTPSICLYVNIRCFAKTSPTIKQNCGDVEMMIIQFFIISVLHEQLYG
jgi:hypothetical protein